MDNYFDTTFELNLDKLNPKIVLDWVQKSNTNNWTLCGCSNLLLIITFKFWKQPLINSLPDTRYLIKVCLI